MRLSSYIIGIVFTCFALLQLNDPDFYVWVPAYLLPAAVGFVFPHRPLKRPILALVAITYLIAALLLFPTSIHQWIQAEERSQSFGMVLPGVEESRESMGLLLCFIALSFFWLKAKPVRDQA
jgi:hypothetical protein